MSHGDFSFLGKGLRKEMALSLYNYEERTPKKV
jgi:hypothetical protein